MSEDRLDEASNASSAKSNAVPSAPPTTPIKSLAHQTLTNQLSHSMYNVALQQLGDEQYMNFSEALYGIDSVIPDADVRRIPSVLSLFSETSEDAPAVSPSTSFPHFVSKQVGGGGPAHHNHHQPPSLSIVTEHGQDQSASSVAGNTENDTIELAPSVEALIPRLQSLQGKSFNESLTKLGVQIIDDVEDYVSDDEAQEAEQEGHGEGEVEGEGAKEKEGGSLKGAEEEAANESSNNNNDEEMDLVATEEDTINVTAPSIGASPPAPAVPGTNPLYMTSSFVKSMSEYAFRREALRAKIADGTLVASMTPSKRGEVPTTDQINLDFYTDENQARRRHIKKHPQFVAIAKKLWDCIDMIKDDDGNLTLKPYLALTFKITCLIVPPPIDADFAKKTALEDWESDTKSSGRLVFSDFFNSIFQLCDTWTESCNAEDYIEMLLHIIDGICFNNSGSLQFKKDEQIKFDKYFSILGDMKNMNIASYNNGGISSRLSEPSQEEEAKPSSLAQHSAAGGGKKKKGNGRKKKEKTVVLPMEKVLFLIGKLLYEKAKADNWIARKAEQGASGPPSGGKKSKSLKKVRFDAFIMKYFTSQHGTKGIARRHLRNFVVSVQHLASSHSRIEVFRKLSGIPNLNPDGAEPFIPGLVGRYYIPLLTSVCSTSSIGGAGNDDGAASASASASYTPDITKVLKSRSGEVSYAPLSKVIDKVSTSLLGVYFGSRMLSNYKDNLANNHCSVLKGEQVVDIDQAMDLAYQLFVYSDSMRAFSRVRAARCLQRWYYKFFKIKGGSGGDANAPAVGGVDNGGGDSSGDGSSSSGIPSPRRALLEAKEKDREINGEINGKINGEM